MLEDGEISCSSIDSNSHESNQNGPNSLEGDSINFTNSLSTSLSKSKNKSLAQDDSLIEKLFSMDVSDDQQMAAAAKPKKRKPFTVWSDQLIKEQAEQIREEQQNKVNASKNGNRKFKDLPRTKKEQKNLVSFAVDIAQCLQERRKDIVCKYLLFNLIFNLILFNIF